MFISKTKLFNLYFSFILFGFLMSAHAKANELSDLLNHPEVSGVSASSERTVSTTFDGVLKAFRSSLHCDKKQNDEDLALLEKNKTEKISTILSYLPTFSRDLSKWDIQMIISNLVEADGTQKDPWAKTKANYPGSEKSWKKFLSYFGGNLRSLQQADLAIREIRAIKIICTGYTGKVVRLTMVREGTSPFRPEIASTTVIKKTLSTLGNIQAKFQAMDAAAAR